MKNHTKNKLSAKQIWARYSKHYHIDQKNFYKSFFIRFFFNFGHQYIHSVVKNRTGTVVDIGSGIGYHVQFEDLNSIQYICVDKNPKLLAQMTDPRVKKIVADCSTIPLASHSVDTVIASHILEHVHDLSKCIRELKRILKQDGKLVVVLPCDPGLMWNTMTFFSPSRARLKKLGLDYDEVMRLEHVNPFTDCVSALNKEFNLKNESYYPFGIKSKHLNLLGCFTGTPKK